MNHAMFVAMNPTRTGKRLRLASCGISVLASCTWAHAAVSTPPSGNYPARPVRLLVGFAPGGATDTTARLIAKQLAGALGQPIVVDNRPGAAGNVAAEIVARSDPDGHTLLMGTIAALAINPTLYGNLPFSPVRDFAPITQTVNSTSVLLVHPSVKAASVKQLIALAKASPGRISYGSSGMGSAGHLAGELFCSMARVKMIHVPHKGSGVVMNELLAGQMQAAFVSAAAAIPHLRAGKVRPIGVTTLKRAGMLPDIPTIAEQGLKGFDANNWYGLLAPAGTPKSIIETLNAEVVKILNRPDVRQSLLSHGLDPAPTTPQQFAAYLRSELLKWTKVVRKASASP